MLSDSRKRLHKFVCVWATLHGLSGAQHVNTACHLLHHTVVVLVSAHTVCLLVQWLLVRTCADKIRLRTKIVMSPQDNDGKIENSEAQMILEPCKQTHVSYRGRKSRAFWQWWWAIWQKHYITMLEDIFMMNNMYYDI